MSRIFLSANRFGTLVAAVLFIAVLVRELRTPSGQRTWTGELAGFVPYDLRLPSVERLKASWWSPDESRILTPMVWGVGWAVNVGRLARKLGMT
ncbi:MAG: hypothetical protein AB7V46_24840 [Thermomicrobiales bacterium]